MEDCAKPAQKTTRIRLALDALVSAIDASRQWKSSNLRPSVTGFVSTWKGFCFLRYSGICDGVTSRECLFAYEGSMGAFST